MSKLAQTAKSRKFLVCAAASAFLTLNWHFGWMPMEIAVAIVAPFLGWVGVEGYMDAQKTKEGAGALDAIKSVMGLAACAPDPKKPPLEEVEPLPLPTLDGLISLDQLSDGELAQAFFNFKREAAKLEAKMAERKAAKDGAAPK